MKATEVTAGLTESNGGLLPGLWQSRRLRADCLYTGISSGPNAWERVWENFTFLSTVLAVPGSCLYNPSIGTVLSQASATTQPDIYRVK